MYNWEKYVTVRSVGMMEVMMLSYTLQYGGRKKNEEEEEEEKDEEEED